MCHNVGHRLEGAEHSTTDGKDSSKLRQKKLPQKIQNIIDSCH